MSLREHVTWIGVLGGGSGLGTAWVWSRGWGLSKMNLWSVLDRWLQGRLAVRLAQEATAAKSRAYTQLDAGGVVYEKDPWGGERILLLPPRNPQEVDGHGVDR